MKDLQVFKRASQFKSSKLLQKASKGCFAKCVQIPWITNPYKSPWGCVSSIGMSKNVTKDFSFLIKYACPLWSKALHVQYKTCDIYSATFHSATDRTVILIKWILQEERFWCNFLDLCFWKFLLLLTKMGNEPKNTVWATCQIVQGLDTLKETFSGARDSKTGVLLCLMILWKASLFAYLGTLAGGGLRN